MADRPSFSAHFQRRQPSDVRVAGIRFAARRDGTEAINVAIGNVSLPMHPAMIERLRGLGGKGSPFREGVVRYSGTVGEEETRNAFLHVIASSGFSTEGLHAQITDGGSQAMELVCVGLCGPAGSDERPLLLIDAAYPNYKAFAERLGRATVSIQRSLGDDGRFSLPSLEEIERLMIERRPGAMVVIPYDNPTGQFYGQPTLTALARLCVKHDLWMVSDEAYRELFYVEGRPCSIWGLKESEVPGITGRRVGIETTSKVWNACGLRIGALVTDNEAFHRAAVAENTAGLCSNSLGQWIFGAIAHEDPADLQKWYARQRAYYRDMLEGFTRTTRELIPGIVVSSPDAAIYSVVDVRDVVADGFDALQFVLWCASEGRVEVDGKPLTLLTAPMAGFYNLPPGAPNPGRTQMRIAYVETPERMGLVPRLLAELLEAYEKQRG